MNKIFKMLVPFLSLFSIVAFLSFELFHAEVKALPTAMIGENLPPFRLQSLLVPSEYFSSTRLKGEVSLLNVWASWCYACGLEHEMLMKIKNEYHVPIYSINYKDDPADAKHWLQQNGNPFIITGLDSTGDVAIDLGIYGTPETFVINKKGKIVYRQVGVINQETWDTILFPLITRLKSNS